MSRRDENFKNGAYIFARTLRTGQVGESMLIFRREDDGITHRGDQIPPALLQRLESGEHPRISGSGGSHHLEEEVLAVDFWDRREGGRKRGVGEAGFGVEGGPVDGVAEVVVEAGEEGGGEGEFAALETVPVSVGGGGGGTTTLAELRLQVVDEGGAIV